MPRNCYNRASKIMRYSLLISTNLTEPASLLALLRDWREDTMFFLRHSMPKLVLILVGAFVLVRLLRNVTSKVAALQTKRLPSGFRAQQVRTLASVINSVAVVVIVFVAALMALAQLGLHLEPLLASAGIAGLAIGFGAQTLVHDVINGFFILLENIYDIGDVVKIAGVQGTVEQMSLRKTVLRDDTGAVHSVPNSAFQIISNMTRDWAQVALHVSVDYSEASDRVIALLRE